MLRRSGARAGHELYVTGAIGGAAAGLAILASGRPRAEFDDAAASLVARHERPEPRLAIASSIARSRSASAAMDLSDGLADAARQIAEACGTGVVIDADALPVHPAARAWWQGAGADPVERAIAGGEDYELLFAVAPRLRRRFLNTAGRGHRIPVTCVGKLTAEPGAWMTSGGERRALPSGFTHFG
jgi:thiamine-monophosphate kinase